LMLLATIVYVPFFHEPFGTRTLSWSDWALCVSIAATIVPVQELTKWMVRRGWFGIPNP
jgi:P-type Ca2+ transporter type 2C